ncbi:hypothetical protein [Brucella pseudintermedia]|uniref:hypothetical protein n=1 Tax=Brucella pseudintermedia TaxID=370111 RepID=UPI0030F3C69C
MTEIPQDILAAAEKACLRPTTAQDRINNVARAILAERDRCANVAIQYFRGDEYNSNQRSAGAMIYVAILAGEAA